MTMAIKMKIKTIMNEDKEWKNETTNKKKALINKETWKDENKKTVRSNYKNLQ